MKRFLQILRTRRIIGIAWCSLLAAGAPISLMANSADDGTLYWNPVRPKKETHSVKKTERSVKTEKPVSVHPEKLAKSHANHEVVVPSLAQQAVHAAAQAAPTPERMTAAQRKALLAKALAVTPSTPPRPIHAREETPAANRVPNVQPMTTAPSPASEQNALQNGIVISVPDQKLAIVQNGEKSAVFPISTSRYGVGDGYGTYTTPLGVLEVAQKIGDNLPEGSVFKGRHPTGEILKPNAPGRDPIVTRIIWLRGTEECNRNAYSRGIYIHGTPEERNLGKPASFGCIRMRSSDVVKVFEDIAVGTKVQIANKTLRQIMRENAATAHAQAAAPANEIIGALPAAVRTAKQ